MEKYLNGDLSASIEEFNLELSNNTLSKSEKSMIYLNIAQAQFELELYRKCIKSCSNSLDECSDCLRSYLLQGKAYIAINKNDNAIFSFETALNIINEKKIVYDITIVREIRQILSSLQVKDALLGNTSKEPRNRATDNDEFDNVNTTISNELSSKKSSKLNSALEVKSILQEKKDDISLPAVKNDNNITDSLSIEIVEVTENTINTFSNQPEFKVNNKSNPENITTQIQEISTATIDKMTNNKTSSSKINVDALLVVHRQFIGTKSSQINPIILQAVRSKISNASGEDIVDDLIALGYLQVNTGHLNIACEIFLVLLKYRSNLPAAHLGMGSALALSGKFHEAINCFTTAITVNPNLSDAWKRRGQTYAARGLIEEALSDLTHATTLDDDCDIYFQRGLVYNQSMNYYKALLDFKKCEEKGLRTAQLYNFIGICEGQLGNIAASILGHKKAYKLEENFKEALLNESQMYKEIGDWKKADEGFKAVIALSSNSKPFPQGHWYRSQLLYLIGKPKEALNEVLTAISLIQNDKVLEVQYTAFAAVCWQSQGYFKQAVDYYDRVLNIKWDHHSKMLKEICIYIWNHLYSNINTFNIDNDIDSRIKDGICKKRLWSMLSIPKDYKHYNKPNNTSILTNDSANIELFSKILSTISPISSWIQLDCRGFLPNSKQHAMFGLSVIQMARALKRHLESIHMDGPGILVSDLRSSQTKSTSSSPITSPSTSSSAGTGKRGVSKEHILNWRDFFDIVVLWRQISEPNDPVWWIDKLPSSEFEEGYGLQTPIVFGQLKTIRYYSYYNQAIAIVKDIIKNLGYFAADNQKKTLSNQSKKKLANSTILSDIYNIIGEDFYVVVPCNSKYFPGDIYEGTRLTLLSHEPDGYEFSIRTPGTPNRWIQYDNELTYSFNHLIDIINDNKRYQNEIISDNQSNNFENLILMQALEMFYYWVTFAPLTRGTAACGYAAFYAILLSNGYMLNNSLPKDKQLDWEAILQQNCDDFINKVISWFHLKKCDINIDSNNDVIDSINTYKSMIQILSVVKPLC